MNSVSRMIVAFAIALPVSASAQTVTRANLVGTWLRVEEGGSGEKSIPVGRFLTLKADSTWKVQPKVDGMEDSVRWAWYPNGTNGMSGRWYLTADSLWFIDPDTLNRSLAAGTAYRVALRDQQLLLGRFGFDQGSQGVDCTTLAFQRIDPSKPLPVPTLPPPPSPTFKRVDLVGSWVHTRSWTDDKRQITQDDTLTLRADSTWVREYEQQRDAQAGKWYLLPGDELWLTDTLAVHNSTYVRQKITLQGQQFLLDRGCGEEAWVYKRVKP